MAPPNQTVGQFPGTGQNAGVAANPNISRPTSRFRSFAERFLIERIKSWPVGCDPSQQSHETILEARTAYNMIKAMSNTVED